MQLNSQYLDKKIIRKLIDAACIYLMILTFSSNLFKQGKKNEK